MLEQSFSESIANLKYNKLYCFLFSSACCFIRLFILLHQHAKKKELKFNCTGKIIFTQLLHLSEVWLVLTDVHFFKCLFFSTISCVLMLDLNLPVTSAVTVCCLMIIGVDEQSMPDRHCHLILFGPMAYCISSSSRAILLTWQNGSSPSSSCSILWFDWKNCCRWAKHLFSPVFLSSASENVSQEKPGIIIYYYYYCYFPDCAINCPCTAYLYLLWTLNLNSVEFKFP